MGSFCSLFELSYRRDAKRRIAVQIVEIEDRADVGQRMARQR